MTDSTSLRGPLGVLTPGLGAVTTTFIAGVDAVRHRRMVPVGSLTQLGHLQTENGEDLGRIADAPRSRRPPRPRLRRLGSVQRQRLSGGATPESSAGGPRGSQTNARGNRADAGRLRPGLA